ncbi:MAG TPA: hypothetical protein VGF82_12435 [Terracidiphilus sp.]|jgi:hypothetical protein
MAFTREQLEEMRRQVEDDYRLDMAAIERLQHRFAASPNPPSIPAPISSNTVSMVEQMESELEVSERPTLIATVLAIVRASLGSLTGRDVMDKMDAQGFPFVGDERRKLTSINVALSRLVEREEVRITRRGSGREPNRYRAVRTEPVAVANRDSQEAA